MLEYARWKYILVAVVLLLALLFALPNVFGDDPALQVARKDHAADDRRLRRSRWRASCTQHNIQFSTQLHRQRPPDGALRQRTRPADGARRRQRSQFKDTYITALSFAPRTPAALRALGLRPMPLGLDLRGGLYLLYQVDVNARLPRRSRAMRRMRAARWRPPTSRSRT